MYQESGALLLLLQSIIIMQMEERQYSIRYRVTMDQECLLRRVHNQTGLEVTVKQMMNCTEKLVASSSTKMELLRLI